MSAPRSAASWTSWEAESLRLLVRTGTDEGDLPVVDPRVVKQSTAIAANFVLHAIVGKTERDRVA